MRILHSADWQIGLKANHVAAVADAVRSARIEAARNVIAAANAERVDAVVLAGDTFEDNLVSNRLVGEVLQVLGESRAPVYVLPGNHDALTHDSVFRRPAFVNRPRNVFLLDSCAPVPVPGTDAVLLPSPATKKKSFEDPTRLFAAAPPGANLVVGVAHGSLRIDGKFNEDDFPIALDACARGRLDYLALGHWHGCFVHGGALAYSGTHETTKFGEERSGQALLVELSRGAAPTIRELRTGALDWASVEVDLSAGAEAAAMAVRARVAGLARPKQTLLRVRTTGQAGDGVEPVLAALQEELSGQLLHVLLERCDVPAAVAQGRIADVAAASALISGLLSDLGTRSAEVPAVEARRLLDELVLEVWR